MMTMMVVVILMVLMLTVVVVVVVDYVDDVDVDGGAVVSFYFVWFLNHGPGTSKKRSSGSIRIALT